MKTSKRIKNPNEPDDGGGNFCGGYYPYGYRLIKNGRKDNRGYDVNDLSVVPDKAEAIRKNCDYYIHYRYGSRLIASEIAAHGIRNRQDKPFHPSSIFR